MSVAFDFATICEYEDVSGKMFNPAELSTKAIVELIYCAVSTHNDDAPKLNDFRKMMSFDEYQEANKVLGDQLADFYHISVVAESHVSEPEQPEEGDSPKNA